MSGSPSSTLGSIRTVMLFCRSVGTQIVSTDVA